MLLLARLFVYAALRATLVCVRARTKRRPRQCQPADRTSETTPPSPSPPPAPAPPPSLPRRACQRLSKRRRRRSRLGWAAAGAAAGAPRRRLRWRAGSRSRRCAGPRATPPAGRDRCGGKRAVVICLSACVRVPGARPEPVSVNRSVVFHHHKFRKREEGDV
eukprot:COSAG06_NODE_2174_length_7412_cov_4.617394_4_plen_162_part_00